ncbi:dolichyl-P-Glc:Man9GlcNAc2-PP-dolichol alpha-1,3-glucosyltransferase [Malassezia cuniculi]|uniref:dolichyl-P-Glc:Man9GlcNAc2-PP-dolichol alpha-1,3-glucosyltransferase n=1 Tax=Malassezia cuniculi TaxID=948313 RepID=A0AAF0EU60_9BASI|nr:dolichyl-P-Glc:Man9GlcNAc2-PP-dolichol alpha-1,3-glucosyltransferase [Malassezia cuniculi]
MSRADPDATELDRAADIPLSVPRWRRRAPESESSLLAPPSVASGATPRSTANTPQKPQPKSSSRASVHGASLGIPQSASSGDVLDWLRSSDSRAPNQDTRRIRAARSVYDDSGSVASASRRYRRRLGDTASLSGRIDDAGSARALSSSSRLRLAEVPEIPQKSWERVAMWRDQANAETRSKRPAPAPPATYTDTPLRAVLRAIAQDSAKSVSVLVVLTALLVRCAVALGSWSGRGTPPMYGDFEAQRHWIEITLHLPTRSWYYFDLGYWGLDYPPLTAWVSLATGYVAGAFSPLVQHFALDSSRGSEAPELVLFMRASVVVLECAVYIPAVVLMLRRRLQGRSMRAQHVALATILLQPALILIDHGHFQYNSVMLGLAAVAFYLLSSPLPNLQALGGGSASGSLQTLLLRTLSQRISTEYVAAAVAFTLSLCFKQMALYYAPAVFAAMFGRCVGLARADPVRGLLLFTGLGAVTLGTAAAVFAPWLRRPSELLQVVHRIFPLARGLFEDKVANVWCFLSVLPVGRFKLRNLFAPEVLAKISLVVTLLAILPSCILLFRASTETTRLEGERDETVTEKVLEKVQKRASSVASMSQRDRSVRSGVLPSARGTQARSQAGSAKDSSRGSDRVSIASGSLISASTWRGGGGTSVRAPAGAAAAAPPPSVSPSPAAVLLPYTLFSSALAFFLFGFQTHEKSILLPLMPLTLLLVGRERAGAGASAAAIATDWEWAVLGNNVAVFSLWPLLLRDGLVLQHWALTVMWNLLIGYRPFTGLRATRNTLVAWIGAGVHAAMLGVHALEAVHLMWPELAAAVFQRYPDLFPVLNVLVATPVLAVLWLWSLRRLVEVSLAAGVIRL